MDNPDIIDFGEAVHSYSRADAIADGDLVDLTSWARESGFKYPVAITRAAWASFIEWPKRADGDNHGQSERGRAHDVLWMLFCAIKACGGATSRIDFKVSRIVRADGKPHVGALYSLCGPGDDPAPVITIMLPEED